MAKHLIDLSVDARYEGNASDIEPYSNGEAATEAVFNRPPQNLRQRVETLRQEVEDLKYVTDADRAMVLAISGTLTATRHSGGTLAWSLGLSSSGYLLVRPFAAASTPATGTVYVGSTAVLDLSIDTTVSNRPRSWGQPPISSVIYAKRGANNIKFTFVAGSAFAVAVADGDQVTVTVPSTATVTQLREFLLGDALDTAAYANLAITAEVAGGNGSVTVGVPTAVVLAGASDPEAHKITDAYLTTFFGTTANRLEDGDTLAIGYDQLVDVDGTGGRRQVTAATNIGTNLFNTRLAPAKIPGCIPVATVVGDKLFLIDGTVMTDGESITDSGSEYLPTAGGTVSGNLTVQGNTTLGDGIADATRVNGTFAVGEAGGSADAVGSEPFRVTKDGAVTAASVATGAVTATSLDAGSGTIQTTGTAKAADAVFTTSLGVGAANYASSEFRVTDSGAVTAASLDTGSGTIQTTGMAKAANAVFTTSLGVGGTDYTGSEFKVDANGAVTAASVATGSGAITGGSLEVTGTAKAADAVVSGTLGVGAANYADSEFRVTSAGAVTAASVNAGSGIVQTTGAVSGGTVTATTSVTAPSITSASGGFNVGTSGQTTAVLGNLGVNGTLKSGTDDAFQVDAAGAVTAASVAATSATLGTQAGTDGTLTVYNDAINGIAIEVKNGSTSKFKVDAEGDVTAAGNLDVAGTIYAGSDNAFSVESSGRINAPDALIGTSADSGSSGSVSVYNSVSGGSAIRVYNTALNTNIMSFNVDAQGQVIAKNLTLGDNDGDPDGQLVINNNNTGIYAIDVKNASITKFSVSPTGAVVAAELTLGGVSVPPPGNFQRIFYTGSWSVSNASGGANNTITVTASAGTYLATLAVSLNTNSGPTGETDWCLLTSTEDTANSTRDPNGHATAGTAPYVSVHMSNGQSSALTITRVLTLTLNESLVALGYINAGSGAYLVRGSLTLLRIA
jgi:hypothetical protein